MTRPISSTSRKPAVTSRPVFAPVRSIKALVPVVEPCTTSPTLAGSIPVSAMTARMASITPSERSLGVVNALAE
jgi:hypothetical protein